MSAEQQSFSCSHPGCGKSYSTARGLTRHLNNAHSGGSSIQDDVGESSKPLDECAELVVGGSAASESTDESVLEGNTSDSASTSNVSKPYTQKKGLLTMPSKRRKEKEADDVLGHKQDEPKVKTPFKKRRKAQVSMHPKRAHQVRKEKEKPSDDSSAEKVVPSEVVGGKSSESSGSTEREENSSNTASRSSELLVGKNAPDADSAEPELGGEDKSDEKGVGSVSADNIVMDDETKLLLGVARNAFQSEDIIPEDDAEIVDWLLDKEYSKPQMEDFLIELTSMPESEVEDQDTQSENVIENVVSDVVNINEKGFLSPSQEMPDEEDGVTLGFDYDFLLVTEDFEENPYAVEPILVEDQPLYDPECWESQLASELVPQLSPEWVVQIFPTSVKLLLLSTFENVTVQRAICWDGGEAKIYIHNKELPKDSFLKNIPTPQSQEEVCDYLLKLSQLVQNGSICKGVRLYSDEWQRVVEEGEGHLEPIFYQNVNCLRDSNCLLIVSECDTCSCCRRRKNLLKHRNKRKKNQSDKDTSKINIRFLTVEETKAKLSKVIETMRTMRTKMRNLQASLRRFVEKNTVEVGSELSNDLAKVFKKNYDKLNKTQQLFWGEQMKALSRQKDLRGMRWNPFVIRLALRIQMLAGPEAYDSLRQIIYLPSRRRLYDFTHFVQAKEGPQEHILQSIQEKIEKNFKEDHEKYFNFLFDEMDVKSDIVIRKSTGEVIGYMNLSPVEVEMDKLEKEMMEGTEYQPQPAKKILACMVQGITNPIQEVVAIFTTDGALSSSQLYSRLWQVIYRCESYKLKILCLIGDGASVNKKFFNMHAQFVDPDIPPEDHPPLTDFVYCTRNIACSDEWRPIFFIIDPPHLLKTLRNCLANSYSHKKTRFLWKGGEDISWTTLEALLSLVVRCKYNGTKLTRGHIKLTAHSCMKVVFAAQVASNSTTQALEHFKKDDKLKDIPMTQLKNVLKIINDWFDCLNGGRDGSSRRHLENELLRPYESVDDPRFAFLLDTVLDFFNGWKADVNNRKGFKDAQKERMFISHQSYESLKISTYGFVFAVKYMLKTGAPRVIARLFNQDRLEQFFGLLRMEFGGNRNPTVDQTLQKVTTLHVQGQMAIGPRKGNTQVQSSDYVPDESPLPKRQKHGQKK